jgi:hypothetical protein
MGRISKNQTQEFLFVLRVNKNNGTLKILNNFAWHIDISKHYLSMEYCYLNFRQVLGNSLTSCS